MGLPTDATFCIRCAENHRVLGTGVLVLPHLIVTCAHVVSGRDEVVASFFDPAHGDLKATVVEKGDPEGVQDIAVLRLDQPVIDREPLQFLEPKVDDNFVVAGYPKPQEDEIAADDEEDFFHGSLSGERATLWKGWWQLRVGGNEPARSGASGSALWVQDREAAVGLFVGKDSRRLDTHYCIPPSLIDKAIAPHRGERPFTDRRKAATRDMIPLLDRDRVAQQALVYAHRGWETALHPDEGTAKLVEAMWATPLTQLLKSMNQAQKNLVERNAKLLENLRPSADDVALNTAAETIEAIFARMVPQRVVDDVKWRAEDFHGGVVLRIKVSTRPWAEVTAAGYYERAWALVGADDEAFSEADVTPPSRLFNRIDAENGRESLEILAKHLCGLPFGERVTLRRPSFVRSSDRNYLFGSLGESKVDLEEICSYLDFGLKAEADDTGYFHYLVMEASFAEDRPELISLIKAHLKNLHLLILEGGKRFDEVQKADPIHRFLKRSARRLRSDG